MHFVCENHVAHHLGTNAPPKPPEVARMAKESVHPVRDELVRRFSLPRGAARYSQREACVRKEATVSIYIYIYILFLTRTNGNAAAVYVRR